MLRAFTGGSDSESDSDSSNNNDGWPGIVDVEDSGSELDTSESDSGSESTLTGPLNLNYQTDSEANSDCPGVDSDC